MRERSRYRRKGERERERRKEREGERRILIERDTHTTYEQRLKERGSGERVTDTGK